MIVRTISLATAILCLGLSVAEAQDYLTESEIMAQVIGGTVSGVDEFGQSWSETYHPDGRFEMTYLDQTSYGSWEIDGEFLCMAVDDDPHIQGCWAVVLEGDRISLYSEHGFAGDGTLTRAP